MKKSELLERVRFISYGSKKILKFDFSGLDIASVRQVIDYASRLIAQMPKKSVLTLTDVTEANYDREITEALKGFSAQNKPHVIAGAVVGVAGLKKVIFQAVATVSGRNNLKVFDDAESAKDWLANYSTPC